MFATLRFILAEKDVENPRKIAVKYNMDEQKAHKLEK